MNAAATVATLVVGAYAMVLLLIWRFQEKVVFQPPRAEKRTPSQDDPSIIRYVAADGAQLFAHVVGDPGGARGTIVAFHGNAVSARWLIPWAGEASRRFGVFVVLPEYRGYDGLDGVPTYARVALDARAAAEAAATRFGTGSSGFALYGHSLGSAVATELAASMGAQTLVLESPFTSARDLAARWPVPGLRLVWPLISKVGYDTLSIIKTLDVPVFVAHGSRDFVVPVRMGRQIFAQARSPGQLLIVAGAAHNDVPEVAGEDYWRWLGAALDVR